MNKLLEQKELAQKDNLYIKEEMSKEEYDQLPEEERYLQSDLRNLIYYKLVAVMFLMKNQNNSYQ